MATTRGPRLIREDWLKGGLEILRQEGDRGLTIEALCVRMEKTKGSFYHHFSGRKDFILQLLEHWERTYTGRVIEDLEPLGDSRKRLLALAERTASHLDLRLERTIRMWGEREPAARAVLGRVDQARECYLREQFEVASGDSRQALLAARTHLALLVGFQMVYQDLSPEEMRRLYAFVDHLGFGAAPGSAEN